MPLPPARGGLDQQRGPDLGGAGEQRRIVQPGGGQSGHDGHAARGDGLARGDLVAHGRDRLGGRAHEHDPRDGAGAGELRVLGEEAVAGVDRVGPARAGGGEDLVEVEIGVDPHGGVGGGDVRGRRVLGGVDGDAGEAERTHAAEDAQGDLAAVGDQDAVEAHRRLTSSARRGAAGAAGCG